MYDIADITVNNSELSFIRLVKSFDFLRNRGYIGEQFRIYGRGGPSVTFAHQAKNRRVNISWCENELVTIIERRRGLIPKGPWQSFSVNEYYKSLGIVDPGPVVGESNRINIHSDFIRKHLLPVIDGEKWIDDLM